MTWTPEVGDRVLLAWIPDLDIVQVAHCGLALDRGAKVPDGWTTPPDVARIRDHGLASIEGALLVETTVTRVTKAGVIYTAAGPKFKRGRSRFSPFHCGPGKSDRRLLIDRHRGGAILRLPPLRPEHRAVVADALEAGGASGAAARLRE